MVVLTSCQPFLRRQVFETTNNINFMIPLLLFYQLINPAPFIKNYFKVHRGSPNVVGKHMLATKDITYV